MSKTPQATCLWTEHQDGGLWDTRCGQKWIRMDTTPAENGVEFCPYCGHPVESRDYVEPKEGPTQYWWSLKEEEE